MTTLAKLPRLAFTLRNGNYRCAPSRLPQAGAQQLDRPLRLLWERCTALDPQLGYHPRGPCTNQTPGVVSVGGVDYGDFTIP